jgi:rare lipoprotein A
MLRILGTAALAAAIALPLPATAKTCLASYYGGGERLNRHTANGEVFRPNGLTAAHRSHRFGTRVRVSLGKRSVVVRINDRGPAAYTGRCIDLSKGAASKLGMIRRGAAKVTIRPIR